MITNSTARKPRAPEDDWFSENRLRTKLAMPAINAVIAFMRKANHNRTTSVYLLEIIVNE